MQSKRFVNIQPLESLAAKGYIRKAQRGIYEICRYGD